MGRGEGTTVMEPATCPAQPGTLRLDILGIALSVRGSDSAALTQVEALCRSWQAPAFDPAERPLELEIEVVPLGGIGQVRIFADMACLEASGNGVSARADARLGRANCRISDAWVASGKLAEQVVEPLLLFLLSHHDRTPIHAAACMIGDVAVVLAGPSGTGKSCLAYAARQAGLAVLSDDTVHVQLRPSLHVWGLPRPIHLFPADAPQRSSAPLRWRNGKLKRAVPHAGERPLSARHAVLCLLARGDGVALEIVRAAAPVPPLEPGFDLIPAQSHAAYSALGGGGHARLTLGSDPAEAIAALCRHGDTLARIAAS